MKNTHRFFQNTDCRYFPCHAVSGNQPFNCLFCFCPLYFLDNCGGDHRMLHGVKDCTPCLRPHRPDGYDEILARLREEATKRRESAKDDGLRPEKTKEEAEAEAEEPGTSPLDPTGRG